MLYPVIYFVSRIFNAPKTDQTTSFPYPIKHHPGQDRTRPIHQPIKALGEEYQGGETHQETHGRCAGIGDVVPEGEVLVQFDARGVDYY